jgi:hypothetical protein
MKFASLKDLLESVQKGVLRDILLGGGVMMITAGSSILVFNTAIQLVRSSVGNIATDLVQIMGLAGVDTAISLTLGAIATRLTLQATKATMNRF